MTLGNKALLAILILATAVMARPDVSQQIQRRFISFDDIDRFIEKTAGFLKSFNTLGTSFLSGVGKFTNFLENNKDEISSKIKETTLRLKNGLMNLADVVEKENLERNFRSVVGKIVAKLKDSLPANGAELKKQYQKIVSISSNIKPNIKEGLEKLVQAAQNTDIKESIKEVFAQAHVHFKDALEKYAEGAKKN